MRRQQRAAKRSWTPPRIGRSCPRLLPLGWKLLLAAAARFGAQTRGFWVLYKAELTTALLRHTESAFPDLTFAGLRVASPHSRARPAVAAKRRRPTLESELSLQQKQPHIFTVGCADRGG